MTKSNTNPSDRRALSEENRVLFASGRRRCSACRLVKRLSVGFTPSGTVYQTICKVCRAKKRREKWAANPRAARSQQQDYRERKLLENRDPRTPLLDVPRLADGVIVDDLDKIIAKSRRCVERAHCGR